jgi:protein-L-isoaspartate O-methyltransferase
MIVPVGGLDEQVLKLVVRQGAEVRTSDVAPVRFVPLFGTHGWEQQP